MYMMMLMMINALKNALDYKVPKCKAPKCKVLKCRALKLLVIIQNLDITHLSSPSSSNLVEEIS